VGKSTLTTNLGALLADAGHKVLLVDTDSQATLPHYFPIEEPSKHGIAAFLTEGDIESTVSRMSSGCDLIRSDHSLGELQNWVLHTPDSRVRMKHTLSQINWLGLTQIG
jgi:chromosome partitioning related protein ParA